MTGERKRIAVDAMDAAWAGASRVALPARPRAFSPGVLLLVILVHALLAWFAHRAMQLREAARAERDSAIEVRFIEPDMPADRAPPLPDVPVVAPSASPDAAPRVVPPAPPPLAADTSMSARFIEPDEPASPPPPPMKLFNSDGSVRLSQDIINGPRPPPRQYQPRDTSPSPQMAHQSPLPYESTRFNRAWVPDGENLGQKIIRKFPLAGILLSGELMPKCKVYSIAKECEDQAVPQVGVDYVPDDISEDPGMPR
jgi:hypothetical protein